MSSKRYAEVLGLVTEPYLEIFGISFGLVAFQEQMVTAPL